MIKPATFILAAFFFLSCLTAKSQQRPLKYKKQIVGLWKFKLLYENKSKEIVNDDSCVAVMTYLFRENGSLRFENTDRTVCEYGNSELFWTIIKLHDDKGKERFAVRITEERMPERASYDGSTFNDEIFMIMSLSEKKLIWIPKPQYKQPSVNDIKFKYFRIH
jgi:hypothetical protein